MPKCIRVNPFTLVMATMGYSYCWYDLSDKGIFAKIFEEDINENMTSNSPSVCGVVGGLIFQIYFPKYGSMQTIGDM